MRLIDSDALKDEMQAGCVPIDLGGITGITGDDDSIGDYIDAAPTIDAIPVEWLANSGRRNRRRKMADFVQTMKDWRRMCKAIGRDSCAGCKLHAAGNDCVAVYEGEMDYAQAEKVITEWAAEHPEPVYPTWGEWLGKQGIVKLVNSDRYEEDGRKVYILLESVENQIPSDLAEKLGLQLK